MAKPDVFQTNRNRIFKGKHFQVPDSRNGLIVAWDDKLISGVSVRGTANSINLFHFPQALARSVTGIASAVLDHAPHFARFQDIGEWPDEVAIITNVSGSVDVTGSLDGTRGRPYRHLDKKLLLEPDEAISAAKGVHASAISFHLNHTSDEENQQLRDGTRIGLAAREHGFEYLVHAYPRRLKRSWITPWRIKEYHYRELRGEHTNIQRYKELIEDAAIEAMSIGATTVKLPRPGRTPEENLDAAGEIVEFVHRHPGVKVVFAGGSLKSASHFLNLVESDMNAGADGEAVGRRHFRSKVGPPEDLAQNARRLLIATADIVYKRYTAEEAIEDAGLDRTA